MKRSGSTPAFLRPAILEAVLLFTGVAVAVVTVLGGQRMQCTALVEFGMLSAIAALSAAALFARYAIEVCGILANYRAFEYWAARAYALGYLLLGVYAAVNGVLDLELPRRDPDWVSYPGLAMATVATLVTLLVLASKYRMLEHLSSRSLFDSLPDDRAYVGFGVVTMAVLVAHIFAPAWWLDTVLDGIFVVLVALKLHTLWNRRLLLE